MDGPRKRFILWRSDRLFLLALALFLACYQSGGRWSCGCPWISCDDLVVTAPAAYAVGGEGFLAISLIKMGSSDQIATVEAVSEKPDVVEVLEASKCGVRLAIHNEGTSRIKVRIRDSSGEEDSSEIVLEARVPKRIGLTPVCATGGSSADASILLPTKANAEFHLDLVNGDPMAASNNRPFDPGALTFVEEKAVACTPQTRQTVVYRTPDFPTQTRFNSLVDPSFLVPVRVFDQSDLDSLRIAIDAGTAPTHVGSSVPLQLSVTIEGRLPCVLPQTWSKSVATETPEVCGFPDAGAARVETNAWTVEIRALAVGTCRVRAALQESELTATLELEVLPPPPGRDAGRHDASEAGACDGCALDGGAESFDAGDGGEAADAGVDPTTDAGDRPDSAT